MAKTRAQTRAGLNKALSPVFNCQAAGKVHKRKQQPASYDALKRTELSQTKVLSCSSEHIPTASSPPKPSLQAQIRTPPTGRKRQREGSTSEESENHAKRLRSPDPVAYWARKRYWPQQVPNMENALARKRPTSSLTSRKRSGPDSVGSATPSDQRPREEKSAPYRDARYKTLLATKGIFMDKSSLGITTESKSLCQKLLDAEQAPPKDTLFRDDIFEATCRKVEDRNETRVIRDITPLLVPSAEILATYGADNLDVLIESTNEGWNSSIPLTGKRPQPDYSVGFRREAFTQAQLEKLSPFIGNFIAGDQSPFMATYQMYFPFFTCEVKCGAAALDVADRQNAHSMTLAVRGVVELFRLVKREKEVDRQILGFSVSHDHRTVRIYGHYPVIQGKDTKYYRHPINTVDFTALEGRDRWLANRFTRNVYTKWMPQHFDRICSAIEVLPSGLDFDVPLLSDTGLSQELEGNHPSQSDINSAEELDRRSDVFEAQAVTPDTSVTDAGPAKRPRNRRPR